MDAQNWASVALKYLFDHLRKNHKIPEAELNKAAQLPQSQLVAFLNRTPWGRELREGGKRFFIAKHLPKTPLDSVIVVGPPLLIASSLMAWRMLHRRKKPRRDAS